MKKLLIFILEIIFLTNCVNASCPTQIPDGMIYCQDFEGSDIDLYIQSNRKSLDLKKFEKTLNRKISLFYKRDFGKLSKELKNNIVNGTILKGHLRWSS